MYIVNNKLLLDFFIRKDRVENKYQPKPENYSGITGSCKTCIKKHYTELIACNDGWEGWRGKLNTDSDCINWLGGVK